MKYCTADPDILLECPAGECGGWKEPDHIRRQCEFWSSKTPGHYKGKKFMNRDGAVVEIKRGDKK